VIVLFLVARLVNFDYSILFSKSPGFIIKMKRNQLEMKNYRASSSTPIKERTKTKITYKSSRNHRGLFLIVNNA